MKYRKKPVVIEAFKYDGDLKGADGKYYVPDWAVNAFENGIMHYDSEDGEKPPIELYIDTLEGTHHVSVGDYVIRGVKGELYPCKPDIFEQTYEAGEERCRMAEMKALEFLREWHRMCQKYPFCSDCPMEDSSSRSCMPCKWVFNDIEKVVAIVKKWSEEHLRKTLLQDFLEKYPKAELAYNKFPEICPHSLGYATNKECFLDTDEQFVSEECEECWNRPLEEE